MMISLVFAIIALNALAIALMALPRQKRVYEITVGAAAISLAASLYMVFQFLQFGNQAGIVYVPYLNLGLSFGLTAISAVLLLLSEIVILITATSGNTEKAGYRVAGVMLSLFQIAAVGLFTSQNLLLFFIFWDIGVVAMFLMINVLGSAGRRAASINFLLYELFASSMLLLAIILLYVYTPAHSLDIGYLVSAGGIPASVQLAVLVSLFLAFMTNMAIFPMHFWLPDAYAEASTQGSMLLSGVLTKFGGYGMLLLFAISGLAIHYSGYIAILAAASAIYAAFVLIKQKDLKRAVAYSAMLEMGIILFAISAYNTVAINGAVYGMFAQGISIALAFLAVGVIKSIFDESNIDRLRDLLAGAKDTAYAFIVAVLSVIGFPLTAGFIAEIMIFFGAVQSFGIYGVVPLFAILLMGGYFYSVISNCFLSRSKPLKGSGTVSASQKFGLYALSVAVVVFGLLPFLIMGLLKM